MTIDLSPLDESLLKEITGLHSTPAGAVNIRKDGKLVQRSNSAYIEISTQTDKPGIDVKIAPGTVGETVYIPVLLTQSGLKDVVYNNFYLGEGCDVKIIAGCGIHNDSHKNSQHDGIHTFYCEKNSHFTYAETHYADGDGSGQKILNPITRYYLEEGASAEIETVQLGGVSSTIRDTDVVLKKNAKMVLTERLMTDGNQEAVSNINIELKGDDSSIQIISRSVAKGNSVQVFNPLVIGEAACRGHIQCDAIIMDKARVKAVPAIEAAHEDALLVHEAAIGKIAGDQITKLMTLGLTPEEAEEQILEDFLS